MILVPVLFCKKCSRPIWLPPPIQFDVPPSQSPWRWGNRSLNVACLACNRVFEYTDPNIRWGQLRNRHTERIGGMAIHQLSVPCGIENCAGRIHILVAVERGSPPSVGGEIVANLFAKEVQCEKGHKNTGSSSGTSSWIFEELRTF